MLDTDPTRNGGRSGARPRRPGRGGAPSRAAPERRRRRRDEAATAISVALAPPVEEPTELGDLDAVALDGLGARPLPTQPLPFLKRKVYGRYRSAGTPCQVELRVDVDGPSPTMRISADYYAISGATVSYFGSMRVDAPAVAITATPSSSPGSAVHVGRGRAARGHDPARAAHVGSGRRDDAAPAAERKPRRDLHLPVPRPGLPHRALRAGLPGHGAVAVRLLQHRLTALGRPARTLSASRRTPRRACSC